MASRSSTRRLLLPLGTVAASAVGYWSMKTKTEDEEAMRSSSERSFSSSSSFTAPPSPGPAITINRPLLLGYPTLCAAAAADNLPDFTATKVPVGVDSTAHALLARFVKYGKGDVADVGKFKKEKNAVSIYTIKEGAIPDPAKTTGLPFARIGETVINVSAKQVADAWWAFDARQEWDSLNTTASKTVQDIGATKRLVYLKGAAKPMISPRDFGFVIAKLTPQDVGARPGSYAFLQVNAADSIAPNSSAVRGNVNSLIIMEPITPTSTRVRYVVELEPKGWLPAVAVEAAADDLPGTLGVLKKHLEEKGK